MSKHRARKRFGQHFLRDPGTVDAILRAINASGEDVVVEIGPGLGAMTNSLAASAGRLHAVELDRDLADRLRKHFAEQASVSIHESDALDFDFATLGERLRIVGNLPYNISTPLLFHLLEFKDHIVDMHFMLQKEVVDRMAAGPGSKAYGRLSIMLGCHLHIESLFDVEPDAFDPPPKVMSSIVRLDPLAERAHEIVDAALLSKIVTSAFMKRRKTVRNALQDHATDSDFAAADISPQLRPEQISIEQYVKLSNHLAARLR